MITLRYCTNPFHREILERRPPPIILRLKEILAKPDPVLGYINGEPRFCLGWAREVAGNHVAAQETWRQARSELEPFLKEQAENFELIGDLALTNTGLGDNAAALALSERAMAAIPIEEDAVYSRFPLEILARVAVLTGHPDRAIAALQKLLSIPYSSALAASLPRILRCSGSTQCSICSGMIRAFKSSLLNPSRNRNGF